MKQQGSVLTDTHAFASFSVDNLDTLTVPRAWNSMSVAAARCSFTRSRITSRPRLLS
jgi:hypothetical protein